MRRPVLAGIAAAVLLAPTPALASDFSGLAPFFIGALLIVLLMVVGFAWLVSRPVRQRWLRQAIVAFAISCVLAPVNQSGIDYWGDPYSTTMPMFFFLLSHGFLGDWVGAVLPPLVFFLIVWGALYVISRDRAGQPAQPRND